MNTLRNLRNRSASSGSFNSFQIDLREENELQIFLKALCYISFMWLAFKLKKQQQFSLDGMDIV